jgi:hypothetical protein
VKFKENLKYTLLLPVSVYAALGGLACADEPATKPPPKSVRCEVAVVSPVSGFAECVKPRGAPVNPPPSRPAPTQDECAKHVDLHLAECNQLRPEKEH